MKLSRLVQRASVVAIAVLCVSCTREPPEQSIRFVLLLVVVIFLAPAVSYLLKRRDSGLEIVSLIIQVLAYVIYETGVSVDTDNRADLVFMYPAIALNAWIVFGNLGSPKQSEAPDVMPGVSVPVGGYKCDVCGTTYPSHDNLQVDASEHLVCRNCGGTA